MNELPFVRAQAWVEVALQSWTRGLPEELRKALAQAEHLQINKQALRVTGAGLILKADYVWIRLESAWQERRTKLLASWRKLALKEDGDAKGAVAHPFQRLKPVDFKAAFDELLQFVSEPSGCPASTWEHQATMVLVSRGFLYSAHLEGLYPDQVAKWSGTAAVQALLRQAVLKANDKGQQLKRQRLCAQTLGGPDNASSSAHVAEFLRKYEPRLKPEPSMGPSKTLAALVAMPQGQAEQWLSTAAAGLKISSQQSSLPSVSSGLRLWHSFAVEHLRYAEDQTLPPRSACDALHFLALFRNPGTARNYVSYVRWACVAFHLSTLWWDGQVELALKGLKKQHQANLAGHLRETALLTEDLMAQILSLCDGLPLHEQFGDLFLLTWQFLLRGPSEAVPCLWGTQAEVHDLPPDRHSALWVSSSATVFLRLKKRKNRPEGSLLQRPCICKSDVNPMCLGHRLLRRLPQVQAGWRVCSLSAKQMLCKLHRLLSVLQVAGPDRYTWKSFRAGKATSLALAGNSIHQILQAGEWKSAAILRYVDPDVLDLPACLESLSDADGEEAEE